MMGTMRDQGLVRAGNENSECGSIDPRAQNVSESLGFVLCRSAHCVRRGWELICRNEHFFVIQH